MEKIMNDYYAEADSDAVEMLQEFRDEIVECFVESEQCDTDIQYYSSGDSYHYETHVDRDYQLLDAAELLDKLSEFQVDDSGLWEGQDPRQAVATMAAYTYGNAVLHFFSEYCDELNSEFDAEDCYISDDPDSDEWGEVDPVKVGEWIDEKIAEFLKR
jgi:hypothetical protein